MGIGFKEIKELGFEQIDKGNFKKDKFIGESIYPYVYTLTVENKEPLKYLVISIKSPIESYHETNSLGTRVFHGKVPDTKEDLKKLLSWLWLEVEVENENGNKVWDS